MASTTMLYSIFIVLHLNLLVCACACVDMNFLACTFYFLSHKRASWLPKYDKKLEHERLMMSPRQQTISTQISYIKKLNMFF